jgi:hyperosmotically inducible periplasmic protein
LPVHAGALELRDEVLRGGVLDERFFEEVRRFGVAVWMGRQARKTHAVPRGQEPSRRHWHASCCLSAMSLNEKTFASKVAHIAAVACAALLAAACDRPLAQAATAADTLPPPPAGNAHKAPPHPQSAPAAPVPAADPLSDAAITARVASGIHNDPALAGTDLTVNTTKGVVSLTGTVKSPEQVAEAAARAQAPDGVVRLDTHVSVAPP